MLYHHDSRDYATAASEAATRARAKMEGIIEKNRANALSVIEQINTQIPDDKLVQGRALNFVPCADGVEIALGDDTRTIHRNAMGQLAARADVPMSFVSSLQGGGEWAHGLLAHNLSTIYHERFAGTRFLARSVDGDLRGFLSDKYRRLDSRPIVDSFVGAAQALGAVPAEGYALETKIALKAMLPMVFEPVPNEVMCFGICLENSDFGNGALSVRAFMLRLWCTNFAISESAMKQVHLGARLNDSIAYSDRTYRLDTEASASAVGDLVKGLLGPTAIDAECNRVRAAHEEAVNPGQVKAFLKANVTKAEADAITSAFNGADVQNMPAGQTKWRLSNAVSWIAGQTADRERALDLMKVANKAVPETRAQA